VASATTCLEEPKPALATAFRRPALLPLFALLALPALFAPVAAQAQKTDSPPPQKKDALAFGRAEHLRLGVNLNRWFAAEKNNPDQRRRNNITGDDLRFIRDLGFDHVRLPVDPLRLYAWQRKDAAGTAYIGEIDWIAKEANRLGLAFILDAHPSDEFNKKLPQGGASGESLKNFAALWEALAAHFAHTDPRLVFFEILNEPHQPDQDFNWNMHKLIAGKIRAAAPNHTIIASPGSRKADISGLLDIGKLLPFSNIIYTFHNYRPEVFTHQGANWTTWMPFMEFHYLPYPSTPQNVVKAVDQAGTAKAKALVKQYGEERWDGRRIEREVFAPGEEWSERNGVPVYVGEFGVLNVCVDPAMRAQCIRDMRVAMQKHKLGGAMWAYQSDFGLVKKDARSGKPVADPAIVKALGLAMPPEPR